MTKRPQTSTEYTILSIDAKRGTLYSSFEDFWERRMEPLQFIAKDAKGPLAHIRDRIMDHAREQWDLFQSIGPRADLPAELPAPQVGELPHRVLP